MFLLLFSYGKCPYKRKQLELLAHDLFLKPSNPEI
jgi:hypothetical protein